MKSVIWAALMLAGTGVAAQAEGHGLVSRLDPSEWVGEFRAGPEQQIIVTMPAPDALQIEGYATFGASDPERVASGAVNVGEFSVRIPVGWIYADNSLEFAVHPDGAAVPVEAAEPDDCVIGMKLDWNINWIDASDNNRCGGLNVSFTGRYEYHGPAGE